MAVCVKIKICFQFAVPGCGPEACRQTRQHLPPGDPTSAALSWTSILTSRTSRTSPPASCSCLPLLSIPARRQGWACGASGPGRVSATSSPSSASSARRIGLSGEGPRTNLGPRRRASASAAMSSFRGLGHSLSHSLSHSLGNGGDRDRDCLSLTVPLNPYIGCPTVSATGSAGAGPAEVRLAGVDTKEKMYEPKQRKKLVRVLTVVAYLFFVSLAAAMLSLYYVFLWNPKGAPKARHLIPPTDEQLRVQEQAVLRDLQRIQDQRRYNEMTRQREREREQVLALQMVQDLPWTSTPQPDYADFTENVVDDDMYTMQPPPLPVFRHHGATGAGVDLEDADNVIPAAPPRPRPPSGSSEEAEVSRVYGGNGHAALRHSSMHSLHSLRGPRAHA